MKKQPLNGKKHTFFSLEKIHFSLGKLLFFIDFSHFLQCKETASPNGQKHPVVN